MYAYLECESTDRQTDKRTLQLYIIESGIVGYNVIGVYRWILTTLNFIDLVWMVAGVWSDQALEMISLLVVGV